MQGRAQGSRTRPVTLTTMHSVIEGRRGRVRAAREGKGRGGPTKHGANQQQATSSSGSRVTSSLSRTLVQPSSSLVHPSRDPRVPLMPLPRRVRRRRPCTAPLVAEALVAPDLAASVQRRTHASAFFRRESARSASSRACLARPASCFLPACPYLGGLMHSRRDRRTELRRAQNKAKAQRPGKKQICASV